jgi:uncharacterized protein (DUF885 family)
VTPEITPAAARFHELAGATLDELLEHNPTEATSLGDHRFDGRLEDRSDAGRAALGRVLDRAERALGAVDPVPLDPDDRVDLALLRDDIAARRFQLEVLVPHTWDPVEANPGTALHLLLARDFAPLEDRLRSVASRLAAVPDALAAARGSLSDGASGPTTRMPQVHVETAVGQLTGTLHLIEAELETHLDRAPVLRAELAGPRTAAATALRDHVAWLRSVLDDGRADGDPRIGPERFAAVLAHRLSAAAPAEQVLARAHARLAEIEVAIADAAATLPGGPDVRTVLDRLAEQAPDDGTILGLCREELVAATAFVRERDLVTVYDDPVEVIEMPEIHRGVAVAYCDPPGPLEPRSLATFYAVAPTPADWPPERVASFYREYNRHMVRNLTVHEAVPGHVLQLQHSARFGGGRAGRTDIRKALWSGSFVEGWAVYAEQLMAERGFGGAEAGALRMQQLKMQLRMTINAILDAGVHAQEMTEAEAMALMTGRGHQEEGEAVGKWRRALLTHGQLSTYFVGWTEVVDLVGDLRAARPGAGDRQVHDELLGHGSPPARHLRGLLGC